MTRKRPVTIPPGPATTSKELKNQEPMNSRSGMIFGPDGLRSGWGVVLFILLLVALRVLQYNVLTKKLPRGWMRFPASFFLEESVRLGAVLAATATLALLDRGKMSQYGLNLQRYGLNLQHSVRLCALGGLWGFATLSLLVGVLRSTGSLAISSHGMEASAALRYGFEWLLVFLMVGMFEEISLRGYLQYTLARGIGFWWAAIVWSVIFAMMHASNSGESIPGLFQAGVIGIFFCFSLWLTKSLWWAVGFHTAWDWAQSYLFGTANSGLFIAGHLFTADPRGRHWLSGGSTGPEGSVVAPFVLIVPAIALWLMYGSSRTSLVRLFFGPRTR